MELEIDFNNPNILKGYLEESRAQMGLNGKRVFVGKEGGLAHSLFSNDWHRLREPNMNTLNQMNALKAYLGAVEDYVNVASEYAIGRGFKPVTYNTDGVISLNPTLDSHVYSTGIGDVSIESAERFKECLQMIKEGSENFEQRYAQLVEFGKALTGR